MSQALTLALYMITCKEMGVIPKFPGNKFFYNSTDDCSYAAGIADLSVWASTQEHTKNEAFNHVNGDTFVWRYFWAQIGKYFGLEVGFRGFHPRVWRLTRADTTTNGVGRSRIRWCIRP